ncbi:uncharacterized protein LOC108904349 [Anoplophora glabripennis]|uniref:E3 ubiquitin-protein ligase SINAT5 n=1 Tax=Anoplophora glabripennis TaxID=217634 RepID=V5I931_ANOGL|nr:uncharacterized protein LOC108904349 [Anoplophora glabripennis]
MEKFVPPDSVVDQLKCALCDFYLSILPVYLISDDGNQYKCGRCSSIKTMISIKVNMYEHLAKLISFPCSYKECTDKVLSNDVKEHERTCPHRTILCPKANCHDNYKIWSISSHFKDKHSDLFHTNFFTIKNVYAYYNIDVLEKNGKTFISLFDFDDINFGISVCSVENPNGCQYEVKLTSDVSKYSITISNQNVIMFNEREHCFKCVNGSCKSKFHLYKDNRKEVSKRMTTKINRDSVKKMFGSGLITYTITITDKDVKEEVKEKNDTKEDVKDTLIRKAKKIFLQMLECPVCKEYMHPPIYQCLTGHTMCNNCKSKAADTCPVASCDAKIEATRNYILEDLSKKVELPQLEDKKMVKTEGAKRNNTEDVDGAETPSKIQKK